MPKLQKIETTANYTPAEGNIVVFFAEEDGNLVLKVKKSDGTIETMSGGSGGIIEVDPIVEFTIADPVYGRVIALDNITQFMTLASPVWDLKKVRFNCVSAAENISGNVVLIPIVDGVAL